MSKVLLITGDKGTGKSRAARVAAQIAEQHHDAQVKVIDDERAGEQTLKRALEHRDGGGEARRKHILIVVKAPNQRLRIRADRVINLDRFSRYPGGRAVTFAIREAVDGCLAAN
ncbi:hypothetical protein J9978_05710 [Chromobacterium violaceum]|uniref:hypothetical protein n=1 Tax=Chromobacterium violaceum TaxID=536 RepID=UPI001B320A53|nr:hypothetical protein [Chromobacterium violaceum]MBP4048994.1 hypothetical protein [Chromobacterium violaceum]